MSHLIDIHTEELRNAVNIAQRANTYLTDAMQCLYQVVIHDDWGCPERDSINQNTIENRKAAETLQYNSEMFYKNILYTAERFEQAEREIAEMLGYVDGPLGTFLSLVPQGTSTGSKTIGTFTEGVKQTTAKFVKEATDNKSKLATLGGLTKSVDICDFKGILSSLTKE